MTVHVIIQVHIITAVLFYCVSNRQHWIYVNCKWERVWNIRLFCLIHLYTPVKCLCGWISGNCVTLQVALIGSWHTTSVFKFEQSAAEPRSQYAYSGCLTVAPLRCAFTHQCLLDFRSLVTVNSYLYYTAPPLTEYHIEAIGCRACTLYLTAFHQKYSDVTHLKRYREHQNVR